MDGAWAVGWERGISKAYTEPVRPTYMEVGRHGFRMSPRGRGGAQGPRDPMDGARGLWVGQQVSAKHVQHL
jgi:hypothetical protein